MTQEEVKQLVSAADNATAEEIKKMQSERLHKLVDYAREHSPYFKELYANLPENYSLEDLPVTSKSGLMADYNRWPTDPEVTFDGVFEYLAKLDDDPNLKYHGKYSGLATSGTSGTRTPMVRDESHNLIHGEMLMQRLLKEVNSDVRCQRPMRKACVLYCDPNASAYASFLRKKKLSKASDNEMMAFNVLDPIDKLVGQLDKFNPDILNGYPSVIADIAAQQLEGHLDIHPLVVGCSAETMTEQHLQTMRKAWGEDCHILNNYCSTEGGEITMSCRYCHQHVNEDWVILEPLDKDGNPCKPGELSDSVLITDLSNFVQPVIRYQVDDHIVWHNEGCPCGNPRPWISIQGRHGGVKFTFQGKNINTLVLYALKEEYKELVNYQMIKRSETELEVRVTVVPEEKHQEILEGVAARVADYIQPIFNGSVKVTASLGAPLHNKRGGKLLNFVSSDMVE